MEMLSDSTDGVLLDDVERQKLLAEVENVQSNFKALHAGQFPYSFQFGLAGVVSLIVTMERMIEVGIARYEDFGFSTEKHFEEIVSFSKEVRRRCALQTAQDVKTGMIRYGVGHDVTDFLRDVVDEGIVGWDEMGISPDTLPMIEKRLDVYKMTQKIEYLREVPSLKNGELRAQAGFYRSIALSILQEARDGVEGGLYSWDDLGIQESELEERARDVLRRVELVTKRRDE